MKQAIVIISTIILGVAIAGMVLAFKTPLQKKSDDALKKIDEMEVSKVQWEMRIEDMYAA